MIWSLFAGFQLLYNGELGAHTATDLEYFLIDFMSP